MTEEERELGERGEEQRNYSTGREREIDRERERKGEKRKRKREKE
jgi:hypothetical protein